MITVILFCGVLILIGYACGYQDCKWKLKANEEEGK